MCVSTIGMLPMYFNVVASKGKDAYSGLISELTCTKCRTFPSKEKNIDISTFWSSENNPNEKEKRTESPNNSFKRWRRSSGVRPHSLVKPSFKPPPVEKGQNEEMSLLKFLAINALDLSAPASDVLLKSRSNSWFQLSGHPDSLAPAGPGTVWKKLGAGSDNTERKVYEELSQDPAMRDIIPKYYRQVEYKGEKFIELQDLLHGFRDPNVIDIKMGTRTFLESEVDNTKARQDLYQKMISIDPSAPTEQEHEKQAVTKLRYMEFREKQSSTCSHGFRIEAMKIRGFPPVTDLKTVKSNEDVMKTLKKFINGREKVQNKLVKRLCEIRAKVEMSEYFKTHEIIGSSVFMIYDDEKVGAWIIDFAKTNKLPEGVTVNHRSSWRQGNHEEGFLFGLDQLIKTVEECGSK